MDKDNEENSILEQIWNACRDGDLEKIKLLYAEKENKDQSYRIYTTDAKVKYPLHIAATNGHIEVVRFLIENGESVNKMDGSGYTALMQGQMFYFFIDYNN